MAYDSNNRSERLLQGRRFTTDNLTLSQEAFTDVFDLGAGEIFTDDGLIPTGSSQLAYSGSSQDGGIISGSIVNPSISSDVQVLKFHHRHKLKQAADGQREVYYFTTSEPASVSETVTSDQLIENDQQTNFISPKYIIAAHSTRNAEASNPGYKAVVYKSTATDGGSITESAITDDKYVFDYKTGVLTWVGSNQPSSNQFVYMTVYQYVGRTLRSQIDDGSIGGGSGVSSFNDLTDVPVGLVSGSEQIASNISGSLSADAISALDAGILSSSAQIANDISGSLSSDAIATLGAGIVSGSSQIILQSADKTGFTGATSITTLGTVTTGDVSAILPNGVVSGSAQSVANLVGQNVVVATLTAESYIVSSSVTHMTTSFSSGSTIFGDDITDTHQMTGSLFVSGSISFSEIDGGNF